MDFQYHCKPQEVIKALGYVIHQIVDRCPEGSYVLLRLGPEVETLAEWKTFEVKSRVYCRYYYKKYEELD